MTFFISELPASEFYAPGAVGLLFGLVAETVFGELRVKRHGFERHQQNQWLRRFQCGDGIIDGTARSFTALKDGSRIQDERVRGGNGAIAGGGRFFLGRHEARI